MSMIYHERATEDKKDVTIIDVPRDKKEKMAERVEEKFEKDYVIMTDEYRAYNKLEESGYEHHTVNHSQKDYAHGDGNYIHTNNAECLVAGLLKVGQESIAAPANDILIRMSNHFSLGTVIVITPRTKIHRNAGGDFRPI